jgi:hypothetical protein
MRSDSLTGEQILAVSRLDRPNQTHHERRQRYEDVRAALLRVQIQIVALEAINSEHRRVTDPKA